MGLDEAYKKIYEEIQRLPGPDRELAECALKWVYASPQLLTTEEIMSALRVVQKKDGSLSTIGGIEERSLKRMCKNLLIVDSDDHWRFFHLSAREYLDSKVGFRITSQEAHLFCAEICTRSLLLSFDPQDTKFPNPGPTKGANPDRLESPFHPANPFSRHCQVYWPFYARTEVVGAPHLPFLERFLGSPTEAHSFYLRWLNFALSFRPNAYYEDSTIVLADHARNITQRDYRLELLPKTPIFLIAYFALGETLREWCDKSDITPFSVTGDQNYLLTIAAQSGCVSLCTTLIARGRASAEGDFQLCLSQALFGAVNEGNKPMVEYLIKEGADVNLIPEDKGIALDYSSPIDPAARSGNVDLVKYLVECAGANVRDALGWATESPSEQAGLDITKYLIQDRNTDPNLALYRHFSGSPLVAAAVLCQKRIVRYYLDNTDAHVNVLCQDGSYGSALDAMVGKGSLEELKYFIEKGKANVNLLHECGENGSALSSAVSRGDLKIVKYLVEEAGADVNLQLKAGKHGSAMAAAIAWDRREIIYYIADYAQINLPFLCGKHGSALAAAFHPRNPGSDINMDLVRFFIEAGADVNLEHQTGDYGSPFVAAVFWARGIGIIEYLVDECGANIHACYSTGIHGSALTAAAAHDGGSNTLSILEYLVDLGVQVNVPLHVGVYGSALVAAAARGHLSSVKYLVEKGKASVDYRPMAGSFGSALAAAAANCKCEIMEYLLGKGDSNVNLRLEAGSFGSALTAAIVGPFDFSIPYDVVQPKSYTNIDLQIQLRDDDILLASRAVFASSALWERVLYAVEYLIDAGADVNLMLQAGAYGNALAAATAVGHFDQVQLLVSKGKADVKAQLTTGSFGSALVVAILADSTLRKLSLDYILAIVEMSSFRFYNIHDLSTYIPSDDGALSMIKSTIDSMRGIMAYLLESGADVDQQLIVGPYGSALVAAAAVGSLRHVRFLVEKWNADVNLQLKNGSYANAYEAAITNGHDDIAEYLMQKGSNSEIIGSEPLD